MALWDDTGLHRIRIQGQPAEGLSSQRWPISPTTIWFLVVSRPALS
jgi:hypothetical protein